MRLAKIRRTGRSTIVEAPTWRWRGLAVLCLAFAAGLVLLAVLASPLWWQVFLALFALPFAFSAFLAFTMAKGQVTRLLSVTDEGLELPFGLLYWHEIERVDFTVVAGSDALGIWTYDPYVLARRTRHWWLWVLAFLAQIQRIPPFSFTNFTAPINELYAAIESKRNPTRTQGASDGSGSVATSPARVRYTDD